MRVNFSEGVFSAIGIEPVGSEMQSAGCHKDEWAVPLKTKVLTMLSVSGAFVLTGRYPSSARLHWSLPLPHRWGLPFEVSRGLAWVRVD